MKRKAKLWKSRQESCMELIIYTAGHGANNHLNSFRKQHTFKKKKQSTTKKQKSMRHIVR